MSNDIGESDDEESNSPPPAAAQQGQSTSPFSAGAQLRHSPPAIYMRSGLARRIPARDTLPDTVQLDPRRAEHSCLVVTQPCYLTPLTCLAHLTGLLHLHSAQRVNSNCMWKTSTAMELRCMYRLRAVAGSSHGPRAHIVIFAFAVPNRSGQWKEVLYQGTRISLSSLSLFLNLAVHAVVFCAYCRAVLTGFLSRGSTPKDMHNILSFAGIDVLPYVSRASVILFESFIRLCHFYFLCDL